VGLGKLAPGAVRDIIDSRDRKRAGAAPDGGFSSWKSNTEKAVRRPAASLPPPVVG